MGVTGLWAILQSCAYPVKPDSLEGKILAIDISIWLHHALHGYSNPNLANDKPHIHLILTRLFKLLHYKIKPIFVFDGGVPQLKKRTMLTRQEKRNNTLQNIEDINSRIVKNKIWEDILNKYLGTDTDINRKTFKTYEEKDLFELPDDNYPNALRNFDVGWEKRKQSIAKALKHLAQMGEDVDIDSEAFNKLPNDIQHEILQELQRATKHPPVNNLISKSDKITDFSQYQINRLLDLSKISSKIERVNRSMNLDHVTKISTAKRDFSYQDLSDAQIQRMASDETVHYVLVKRKGTNNPAPIKPVEKNEESLEKNTSSAYGENMVGAGNVYFRNFGDEKAIHTAEEPFKTRASSPSREIKDSDILKIDILPGEAKVGLRLTTELECEASNENSVEDNVVSGNIDKGLPSKIVLKRKVTIKKPRFKAKKRAYTFLNLKRRKEAYKKSLFNNRKFHHKGVKKGVNFQPKPVKVKMLNTANAFQRSNKPIVWTDDTYFETNINPPSDSLKSPKITIDQGQRDTDNIRAVAYLTDNNHEQQPNLFDTNPTLKLIKDKLIQEPRERFDDVMALNAEKGKLERYSKTMSQAIYEETQELFRIMGIPWIIAPMEAEAQCAYLDTVGLTHGSITDDSDILLFGGSRVYKNFYSTVKDEEYYGMQSVEKSLGLDREKLILIAMLVGCDYSFGIRGVGPVMALEILSEFSISTFEDLQNFKEWWNGAQYATPLNSEQFSNLRKKLKGMFIPESFPEQPVYQAFMQPKVEESRETFAWGSPDFEALQNFVKTKLSWTKDKLESYLNPLRKRLAEKRIQHTMDEYCAPELPDIYQEPLPNKRIQNALAKIRNNFKGASTKKSLESSIVMPKRPRNSQKSSSTKPPSKAGQRKSARQKKTKFSSSALQNDFALNLSEDSD